MDLPEVNERLSHGAPTFFIRDKKTFVDVHTRPSRRRHDSAMWAAAPPGAQEALIASNPERYYRPAYVGHRGWVGHAPRRQGRLGRGGRRHRRRLPCAVAPSSWSELLLRRPGRIPAVKSVVLRRPRRASRGRRRSRRSAASDARRGTAVGLISYVFVIAGWSTLRGRLEREVRPLRQRTELGEGGLLLEEHADRDELDAHLRAETGHEPCTSSKIGRSNAGPVAKYSSSVIAGAHVWPWFALPNVRLHAGHVHTAI